MDIGFITEFEVPRNRAEGFEFRFGPLFQTEFGLLQLNVNLLLTNISRADDGNGTYFGYQWQAKYRFDVQAAGRIRVLTTTAWPR